MLSFVVRVSKSYVYNKLGKGHSEKSEPTGAALTDGEFVVKGKANENEGNDGEADPQQQPNASRKDARKGIEQAINNFEANSEISE